MARDSEHIEYTGIPSVIGTLHDKDETEQEYLIFELERDVDLVGLE